MAQTVLSVVLEAQSKGLSILRDLIEQLKHQEENPPPPHAGSYARLRSLVPTLHFMSISVFEDEHFDPLLVIEANFDGPQGPFWAQLEAAIGPQLREILRYCERPAGRTGEIFDLITRPGSKHPLAPFLEAHTVTPKIFHQGNRGLDRRRIDREAELFFAAQETLGNGARYHGVDAVTLHRTLRSSLRGTFDWLGEPEPVRIPGRERLADLAKLAGFAMVALLVLSFPGVLLALVVPNGWIVVIVSLLAALATGRLIKDLPDLFRQFSGSAPAPESGPPPRMRDAFAKDAMKSAGSAAGFVRLALAAALFLAVYVALAATVFGALVAPLTPAPVGETIAAAARVFALGLSGVPFSLCAILLWLRRLEDRDPCHDDPAVRPERLQDMMRREDFIAQNHMGSMVLVKPGLLRAVLIRAGLFGLALILRVVATSGYLGSMRTIHFAHWAMVGNGSRLMFFSNFDGSWESYLDDFIEKAHGGLTLAWGNCIGFPPARFLSLEGATHGRKFKNWARHSMATTLFWFSAYRDYTVNQIERHARVASGLRQPTLSPEEAIAWTRDL